MNFLYSFFHAVDSLPALILPPVIRLCLWGLLFGAFSMWIYQKLSPQEKIKEVKKDVKHWQGKLLRADGEFSEFLEFSKQSLLSSFKFAGVVFIPVVLSAIPVLLVAAWVFSEHTFQTDSVSEAARAWLYFGGVFISALFLKLKFNIE